MRVSLNQTAATELPRSSWIIRAVLFGCVTLAGCAADLVSKQLIFDEYYGMALAPDEAHWWLVQDVLGIQTSTNQGALFGLGQGNSLLFATLSIGALIGIVIWLFIAKAARDWWITLTLAVICGGIIGNLYDRLGLWHGPDPAPFEKNAVRDWIHFRIEGLPFFDPWPNFNIADSLLVCGALSLFVHMRWIAPMQDKKKVSESTQDFAGE